MDIESAYLVIGVFVISVGILLVIDYLFKNKSYEEVVAEQRQQVNALFNTQHKPKVKDKKIKKAGKKMKEKEKKQKNTDDSDDQKTESIEETIVATNSGHKHHVEFTDVSVIEEPVKEKEISKVKPEPVRPILVKRDSSAENIQKDIEVVRANHFDKSHPKDDFALLNSQTNEETHKDKKKNKHNTENEPPQQKNKKAAKQAQIAVSEVVMKVKENVEVAPEPVVEPVVTAVVAKVATAVPAKDKKKKKGDQNALAQLTREKQGGPTINDLMPLVRKADMSRVEVQLLIDLLLNKQQDAPVVEEWSEGKGDPVQRLKKELAENEKLVTDLQDTITGCQSKLREIRIELNAERSAATKARKELEESKKLFNSEHQAFETKMQTMTMQCQQMKDQYNEEATKARKLMEEYSNMQVQRQQMDMHIAQLQEAELITAQLRNEMHEMQNRYTIENHTAMEHNVMQVKQMQHQINTLKEDLDSKEGRIREYQDVNAKMEQSITHLLRQENDLKAENSLLKSDVQRSVEDIKRVEHTKSQEFQALLKSKEEAEETKNKLLMDLKTLNSEVVIVQNDKVKLLEEKEQLKNDNSKFQTLNQKLIETTKNLQEEKVQLLTEKKTLVETKTNGSIAKCNHQSELDQLKTKLSAAATTLQQAEAKHTGEVEAIKKQYETKIEEQKIKNNDLRQKNWKVMEALNAVESKLKNSTNQTASNPSKSETPAPIVQVVQPENKTEVLQRLFGSVKGFSSLPEDKLEECVAKIIADHMQAKSSPKQTTQETPDVSKLQTQVADYKKIIDETEGMLSLLQKHIEQEEIRWRKELKTKEECIERLKEKAMVQNHVENGPSLNETSDS